MQEKLMNFIGGYIHWSSLQEIDIIISFQDKLLKLERIDSSKNINVTLHAEDIAAGILTYSDKPIDLREWAAIVFGIPLIDFVNIEKHKMGDHLTEILWDLSYGVPLSKDMIIFIEELTKPIQNN